MINPSVLSNVGLFIHAQLHIVDSSGVILCCVQDDFRLDQCYELYRLLFETAEDNAILLIDSEKTGVFYSTSLQDTPSNSQCLC